MNNELKYVRMQMCSLIYISENASRQQNQSQKQTNKNKAKKKQEKNKTKLKQNKALGCSVLCLCVGLWRNVGRFDRMLFYMSDHHSA